jgi:hypothetical protein
MPLIAILPALGFLEGTAGGVVEAGPGGFVDLGAERASFS